MSTSMPRARAWAPLVNALQGAVAAHVALPPGYTLAWSGQFEYLQHAIARLKLVVPATLGIIFVLIYLVFRRVAETAIILATVPLGLSGGLWLIWWLGQCGIGRERDRLHRARGRFGRIRGGHDAVSRERLEPHAATASSGR